MFHREGYSREMYEDAEKKRKALENSLSALENPINLVSSNREEDPEQARQEAIRYDRAKLRAVQEKLGRLTNIAESEARELIDQYEQIRSQVTSAEEALYRALERLTAFEKNKLDIRQEGSRLDQEPHSA